MTVGEVVHGGSPITLPAGKDSARDQICDVCSKNLSMGGRVEKDPDFHVPVEGVVREVGAGNQEGVVDEGAFGVELAGFSGLVAFQEVKGPEKDL